jgi:hypothetical protein
MMGTITIAVFPKYQEHGMNNFFLRSLFVLLILCVGGSMGAPFQVFAQTPDGLTPSEETVCDDAGLTGAARGLCNAFCEAMDCDSESSKASVEACERVLDRYMQLEGGNPPCLESLP